MVDSDSPTLPNLDGDTIPKRFYRLAPLTGEDHAPRRVDEVPHVAQSYGGNLLAEIERLVVEWRNCPPLATAKAPHSVAVVERKRVGGS